MSPNKETQKSAKSTTAIGKESKGFTDEERAAMKERAEVQHKVRDIGLQRHGKPRRRRHVADRLRTEGVDRRRRGKNRRTRAESSELLILKKEQMQQTSYIISK